MLLLTGAALIAGASVVAAQVDHGKLTGTWSSKGNYTVTGPGFYDPTKDRLNEPLHPGISYSFTVDGFYESAYYRAIANPVSPTCPKAIMQWQHGKFQKLANGSLVMAPIVEDGRQLTSDPCNYDNSIYTHYNQSELFERYEYLIDPYHNVPRLNLYRFDGSPLPPLYLVYQPPNMLPTTTLHPKTTATGRSKLKRSLGILPPSPVQPTNAWIDADRWWWFGVGVTGLGSFLYFCC
ncbi:hypothetical protein EJ08DRAFT_647185 [Tothia fuscella]|uniref:Protein ROT1 n=1 Tax=Tothia fuscella TaxID=1048955 RepID=A0A9P4NYA1_9PEZI|nr:hypothetical protein EJ08DRAFT_647185 [Tothia fuscella]